MKEKFYHQLQSDFIMVRHLHSGGEVDSAQLRPVLKNLRQARTSLQKRAIGQEKRLLCYCIDTLLELVDEGERQKIFDFADTAHNMPEIYMGGRSFYSFRREIKAFQRKYGTSYFKNVNKISPRFSRKAPKNYAEFFSRSSDNDFKRAHPVGYVFLLLIGMFVLFTPMVAYIAYIIFINPCPNEWTIMLGWAGTFAIGVGLFNIVGAWIHQYLGHGVTLGCILGGAAVTALAMYMLYF